MSRPRYAWIAAIALALAFVLTGCSRGGGTQAPAPEGSTVYLLSYLAGPNWKQGEPIKAQEWNGHFEYMGKHYEDGKVVANGPYGDELRGLYVLAVDDRAAAQAIVDADPAVQNGTLKVAGIEPWVVLMDALGARAQDKGKVFILNYTPGERWKAGKPMLEQRIKPHLKYVGRLFAAEQILAGGPVPGEDRGRYIVMVENKAAAEALVAADPGVRKGVFTVQIRPWLPQQRQSLEGARKKLAAR